MPSKTLHGGVEYEVAKGRALHGGTGYEIQKGRTLVGGVGYDVGFGLSAVDMTVGSSVYADVNGVRTEFLVVHQGLPDATKYDASCDGTWVLMKNIWKKALWGEWESDITYVSSYSHNNVNVEFLKLLDSNVLDVIKPVKIPYVNSAWAPHTVAYGAAGLDAKAFLLSGRECGLTANTLTDDGACLSYFLNAATDNTIRTAYLNGTAAQWASRSNARSQDSVVVFQPTGSGSFLSNTSSYGLRPAFILDSNTVIDSDTFDIIGAE